MADEKFVVRTTDHKEYSLDFDLVWRSSWLRHEFFPQTEDEDEKRDDGTAAAVDEPVRIKEPSEGQMQVVDPTPYLMNLPEPLSAPVKFKNGLYMPFMRSDHMEKVIEYHRIHEIAKVRGKWTEERLKQWDEDFIREDDDELRHFEYAINHLGYEELRSKILYKKASDKCKASGKTRGEPSRGTQTYLTEEEIISCLEEEAKQEED